MTPTPTALKSPSTSPASAAGSSQRTQPVFNPATGAVARQVRLGNARDVDAAVAAAAAFRPGPRRRRSAAPRDVQVPRAAQPPQGRARRHDHLRARQGVHRRQGEVARGIDIVEFACGIPQLLRATTPSRSRPASTTGPCARRSAWSPASRRSTSRSWCRCGCSRSRSPPATPSCSSPVPDGPLALSAVHRRPASAGRPADGVFNVVQGDKEAVDALLVQPGRQGDRLRRLDPIANYIYETGAATASACRPWAAPRTTWS